MYIKYKTNNFSCEKNQDDFAMFRRKFTLSLFDQVLFQSSVVRSSVVRSAVESWGKNIVRCSISCSSLSKSKSIFGSFVGNKSEFELK